MKKLTVLIIFILSSFATYAQKDDLGLFAGTTYYNGDLNPGTPFKDVSRALGLFARHNFSKRLALRGGIFSAKLKSEDFQNRGISFKSNLTEISSQFEVNFYDFGIDMDEDRLTPYIFGGIGLTWNTCHRTDKVTKYTITSKFFNFPFGIGIKYNPITNLSVGLEWGLRKTIGKNKWDPDLKTRINQGDLIDGVFSTGTTVSDGVILPGERVSEATDFYAFAGLTISYRLNYYRSSLCNELRRH